MSISTIGPFGRAHAFLLRSWALFVVALLLGASADARAGDTKQHIDSLQQRINRARTDTARVRLMVELGKSLNESGDHDGAQAMAARIHALCLQPAPNTKVRAVMRKASGSADSMIGFALQHKGDLPGALEHYEKAARAFLLVDDKGAAYGMYQNIANVYEAQGNSLRAYEYYQKSLKGTLPLGDKKDIGYLYHNMGIFYSHQGELQKAQEHYEKSIEYLAPILPTPMLARMYGNIASNYRRMHAFDKALALMRDAFQRVDPFKDSVSLSYCNYQLGTIYKEMSSNGDDALNMIPEEVDHALLDSAERYFTRSLVVERARRSESWLVYDLMNLGRIALIRGRHEQAAVFLFEAAGAAERADALKLKVEIYRALSLALEGAGHYSDAFHYQKLYMTAKDTLYDTEKLKELGRLEAKADFDREAMRAAQERARADAIFQAQLDKQALQRNSLVGGLAAVLLLAGVGYRNYQNKRRAYTEVQHQKVQLEERNKDITDSIRYAKRIQQAVLPTDLTFRSTLPDSFILYKPKDIVSGDFHWFERRAGKALVAVVDCTGHGVPGALMTIVASNGLTKAMNESVNAGPAEILDRLNWYVNESMRRTYDKSHVRDGMDISLCVIDLVENRLRFAGANQPMLLVREGSVIEMKGDKHPVGVFIGDTLKPFNEHEYQLQPNDAIYLFTDGLVDQFGGDQGKKFRSTRLKELLLSLHDLSMTEQHKRINEAFLAWKGDHEQVDDICMVGFRISAPVY